MFLYSTVSSLISMVVIVVIPSSSFSSYCPCWTSWTGWLPPSSVVCFSSYFALPRFAVLRFALRAVGFALLDSFHHRSRSSCSSRCPRTLVALLPSSRHWLVGCGSVSDSHRMLLGCGSVGDSLSHHLLFGCGCVCASFSESLCGRLRLRCSFLASLQHHYSALRPW